MEKGKQKSHHTKWGIVHIKHCDIMIKNRLPKKKIDDTKKRVNPSFSLLLVLLVLVS